MAVKFIQETPLLIITFKRQAEQVVKRSVSTSEVISVLLKNGEHRDAFTCSIEKMLIDSGMPFFNVYPKVLEAISRTSLSIKPESIPRSVVHDMRSICIKLPVGTLNDGFDYIIAAICDQSEMTRLDLMGFSDLISTGGKPAILVHSVGDKEGFCCTCPLGNAFDDAMIADDEGIRDSAAPFVRIVLGVMLLAADPDFIKPVLLKADEGKTTPIEERIARAKNRGVYGFTIGEDIERCPHFRRPHFAIRWTGKGAAIPKLVPVKGAVIGKEIMTTVPTGYETIIDPVA